MSDIDKTVVAIQGNPVKREILGSGQDNYVLTWVNANNEWEAKASVSDVAGGDLSGTYPNPVVSSLTGVSGVVNIGASVIQSTDATTGITISTEQVSGGNGQIILHSGCSPLSTSSGASNIYLDAGAQNGQPQASIYLTTGYGHDNAQEIVLDAFNASINPNVAQIGLTGKNIRFNSTGLCFSQIITVNSNYTINNGRAVAYDYIILGDTTLAAFTITLPPSPGTGETYVVKDSGGSAVINNLTISGNGNNIDGASTFAISTNYSGISVIFNGTSWSIISKV